MRKFIIFTISMVFTLSLGAQTFESATEGASGRDSFSQQTPTGYEYFDASGNLIGSSEKNLDGSYTYYDQFGAEVGRIQGDPASGYTITDVIGGDVGTVDTTPSGKYRYQDTEGDDITEIDVLGGSDEDIGVINPEAFSR
jgi:hypothetical protein